VGNNAPIETIKQTNIMQQFKIPTLKCLRCSHTWVPRQATVLLCPKCKSAYWNTPKKVKKAAVDSHAG
jgi:Zn finger protein HypA/HybF involved in hydrogenase expression